MPTHHCEIQQEKGKREAIVKGFGDSRSTGAVKSAEGADAAVTQLEPEERTKLSSAGHEGCSR